MVEGLLGRILELAREEFILRAPYMSVTRLSGLILSRVKLFFARAHLDIIPPIPYPINKESVLSSEDGVTNWVEFAKLGIIVSLPSGAATFHFVMCVDVPPQNYTITLNVVISTFKMDLPALRTWATEVSALKEMVHAPVIPPGVPLNRLAGHPNACYIYRRLFEVFSAYRDILVDMVTMYLKRIDFNISEKAVFDLFSLLCWNVFIPGASLSIRSSYLPATTVRPLPYRAGQFVPKNSMFANTGKSGMVLNDEDFILLSYEFNNDITYTRLVIDRSSQLSPHQQRYADYLVKAFEDGKLNLQTYKKHNGLYNLLSKDIYAFSKHSFAIPKPSLPPYLNSVRPHSPKPDKALNTRTQVGHLRHDIAIVVFHRFESSVVRERVFISEVQKLAR